MSEKNRAESLIFNTGALVKRGYGYAVANIGKTVAVITSIAVLFVTFGEIGFIDLGSESVSAGVLVMLAASYIIYFSLHDAGEGAGRATEIYKNAEEKYLLMRERIAEEDVRAVRAFLSSYTREELDFRRRSYIRSRGASLSEYERFLSGERVSSRDARTFRRARRMKEIRLTVRDLIERRRSERGAEITNPTSGKAFRMMLRMIPTTLGTLFTVSLMLSVKDGLTAASVIESLVRLSALPIVALRAYAHGYSFASDDLSSWMEAKSRLIDAYFDTKSEGRAEDAPDKEKT